MMATATLVTDSLGGWAEGTRHYRTSDGKYLAVEAMPTDQAEQIIERGQAPMIDDLLAVMGRSRAALTMVIRPTHIFLCDEDGLALAADENNHDPLSPLHVFPPGTTHEAALVEAGYQVEGE